MAMNPAIPLRSIMTPAILDFAIAIAPPIIPTSEIGIAAQPNPTTVSAPLAFKALPIPPTTNAKIAPIKPASPPIMPNINAAILRPLFPLVFI